MADRLWEDLLDGDGVIDPDGRDYRDLIPVRPTFEPRDASADPSVGEYASGEVRLALRGDGSYLLSLRDVESGSWTRSGRSIVLTPISWDQSLASTRDERTCQWEEHRMILYDHSATITLERR